MLNGINISVVQLIYIQEEYDSHAHVAAMVTLKHIPGLKLTC